MCIRDSLPRDEAQAPRLLAVVHRDGAPNSTVLRPDRDDLAVVPDWLAPEFHRAPASWDDAVGLLAVIPDPGHGVADLISGVHLLAPNSAEGVADVDRELRRWLGGGPEIGTTPALNARQFLAAWEPWLAGRGLLSY